MKTVAERLRHAWQQSGKTQTEIAETCGVERPAVSQWMPEDPERATAPTNGNLVRFAFLTGFELRWLLTGQGPRRPGEPGSNSGPAAPTKEQLTQCFELLEKTLPAKKFNISARVRAELTMRMFDVLKPDGSIDASKVVEVIINPFMQRQETKKRSAHHERRRTKHS
jgi:transcriptional regulator with XRE-family HTH domain